MTRYPSRAGFVILPRGDGWHVPAYMPEDAEPVPLAAAKALIDAKVAAGEPPLEPSSVTWDTVVNAQGSHGHVVVHCGQSAPAAGISRGDPVRVTIRRIRRGASPRHKRFRAGPATHPFPHVRPRQAPAADRAGEPRLLEGDVGALGHAKSSSLVTPALHGHWSSLKLRSHLPHRPHVSEGPRRK